MEIVTDFIFWGSKITAEGDCSHEIERRLLLGRKVITNLDSIFKNKHVILPTKVCLVKAMGFPGSSADKESACDAGDPSLIPGSGISPGEGNGNPRWCSCLENPKDRGAWRATVQGVQRVWHDWVTEHTASFSLEFSIRLSIPLCYWKCWQKLPFFQKALNSHFIPFLNSISKHSSLPSWKLFTFDFQNVSTSWLSFVRFPSSKPQKMKCLSTELCYFYSPAKSSPQVISWLLLLFNH